MNNRGTVVGWADTSVPDPFPAFCVNDDCYVSHAFRWHAGSRIDLGAIVDGLSSQAYWISSNGLIAGESQNGDIDPLISGLPEFRAVLWRNGEITNLGTLPEGGYESAATAVNSKGRVIGWATNTVPDANSMIAPGFATTQTRAFLWENGVMRDLGSLGVGTDAEAQFINERGQVAGWYYTSADQSNTCIFPLATGSFLWDETTGLRDLGTLGGDCTIVTGINNKGTVVGDSNNQAQIEHGFLWENGVIRDLGGSLGGDYTGAEAINDHDVTAGWAYLRGNAAYHAAIWRKVGELADLGVAGSDQCSFASAINADTKVVGGSLPDCNFDSTTRAFLWENGSISDLNALISQGSSLHLQWAQSINDRGEIAGTGLDLNGNSHAFVLIPCDNNHPGIEGCDYSMVEASVARSNNVAPRQDVVTPPSTAPSAQTVPRANVHSLMQQRLRFGRFGVRLPIPQ